VASHALRFHPLASDETEAAREWYFQRNPVVAELFLLELDAAVEAVGATPDAWPRVNRRFRRYIMKRFPFSLVYWTRDDEVEVVAVAHHRRRPGYWSTRA